MARWIEVPAHRVLEVPTDELRENYEQLNTDGKPVQFGQLTYRIVRKSDGKLFVEPRFHTNSNHLASLIYLEEI